MYDFIKITLHTLHTLHGYVWHGVKM